jgi:hypothetical protein
MLVLWRYPLIFVIDFLMWTSWLVIKKNGFQVPIPSNFLCLYICFFPIDINDEGEPELFT